MWAKRHWSTAALAVLWCTCTNTPRSRGRTRTWLGNWSVRKPACRALNKHCYINFCVHLFHCLKPEDGICFAPVLSWLFVQILCMCCKGRKVLPEDCLFHGLQREFGWLNIYYSTSCTPCGVHSIQNGCRLMINLHSLRTFLCICKIAFLGFAGAPDTER